MTQQLITRTTTIEDLVEIKEDAIGFLFDRNICCIHCGEPVWDTLEGAARKKNYSEEEIDQLVTALNKLR